MSEPIEMEIHITGLYWPCPACRCPVPEVRAPLGRITLRTEGERTVITPHLLSCEAMK